VKAGGREGSRCKADNEPATEQLCSASAAIHALAAASLSCQRVPFLIMTLRMIEVFLMQAVIATLGFFPAAMSR